MQISVGVNLALQTLANLCHIICCYQP